MILESVQSILTGLEAQGLVEHGDAWHDLVAERIVQLEAAYKELRDPTRQLIDYSDLATQAAYAFRYVIGRVEFTYQIFQRTRAAANARLFQSEELWVISLGGGPGIELLGLIKYLKSELSEPTVSKIVYTVIDKEQNWEHVVDLLIQTIDDIEIEVFFQTFDVSNPVIPQGMTLSNEELCIMSFFISEVSEIPNLETVGDNIKTLLASIPKNGILMYNDNKAKTFINFAKSRVSATKGFF